MSLIHNIHVWVAVSYDLYMNRYTFQKTCIHGIFAFVFSFGICRFSHDVAQMFSCHFITHAKYLVKIIIGLFSSPEPSGSQGELIVYPCSGVHPSSVHNVQTSSPLKPLGQLKPNFMSGLLG